MLSQSILTVLSQSVYSDIGILLVQSLLSRFLKLAPHLQLDVLKLNSLDLGCISIYTMICMESFLD